jgi:hypothetical protein
MQNAYWAPDANYEDGRVWDLRSRDDARVIGWIHVKLGRGGSMGCLSSRWGGQVENIRGADGNDTWTDREACKREFLARVRELGFELEGAR